MFGKAKKKSIRYIALILAVLQIFSIPLNVYANEESKESENMYTLTTSVEEVVKEDIVLESEMVLETELKETLFFEIETILENKQEEEYQEDIILESELILEMQLEEIQEYHPQKRILDDMELLERLRGNRNKQVNVPVGEGTGYVSIGAGIPQNALSHAKLNDYSENAIEARIQYAKINDLLDWIDENGYLIDAYLYGRGFREWGVHSLLVRTGESEIRNGISLFTVSSETPIHDADGPSSIFYVSNEHGTNLAYCGYWNAPTPPAGTATYSPVEITDSIVKKIVYYGNGGAGYGIYTNASWSQTTWAISEGYYARENYFSGIENWADVPTNFRVYKVDTPGAYQPLIYSVYEAQPQNGSLELQKLSSRPAITNGNTNYSLEGAIYHVFDLTTRQVLATITLDKNGYGRADNLPEGAYGVVEVKAPKGYHLNPKEDSITIEANKTTLLNVFDEPVDDPIAILLRKIDAKTNTPIAGAEFTVKYYDVQSSTDPALAGHTAKKTWVLRTDEDGYSLLNEQYLIAGDDFYINAFGAITIPLGTITLQETKAPDYYVLNNEVFVRQIRQGERPDTVVTYNAPTVPNTPFSAKVDLQKVDDRTGNTLEGAEFKIQEWNSSQNRYVDSNYNFTYSAVTKTYTSSDLFYSESNQGKFKIVETKAPNGYIGNWTQEFTLTSNNQTFTYTAQNEPLNGKISIKKVDDETETLLEGAEFKLYVWSESDGGVYKEFSSQIVYNAQTGIYASETLYYTPNNLGKYKVVETKNPIGYFGDWEKEIVLTELNQLFEFTAENTIIRGDVEIVKFRTSKDDNETYIGLKGVEFTFTSKETGEEIVKIITDENGFATTATPAFPRGRLRYGTYIVTETIVPEGMKAIVPFEITISEEGQVIQGIYKENIPYSASIQLVKVDAETGNTIALADTIFQILDKDKNIVAMTQYYPELLNLTEFKTNENGWCLLPNKLEYGTYYVRELKAPNGYLQGEDIQFVVNRDYDWENPLVIEFANNPVKGKVNITKVDTETGEKLEGAVFAIIAKEDIYTADGTLRAVEGEIVDTLTTDYNGYAQSKELYLGNYYAKEIEAPFAYGINLDIHEFKLTYKDEETSLVYTNIEVGNLHSRIKTSAFDTLTGEKEAFEQEEITLVDIVTYENLVVGKEYVIKGFLMDKETNTPFLVDGEKVEAQAKFTTTTPDGSIKLTFTFKGADVEGKTIVVFETLYLENKEVYVHHDIDDLEQTVTYKKPQIGTKASDIETNSNLGMIRETVTIIDVVEYKDLIVGKEYLMKGILQNKETGLPFLDAGKVVTSELTFIAEKSNGFVELKFVVNGASLRGATIVVFETLYYKELEIAVHHDINDKDQTVEFPNPQIGTFAYDKADKDKILAYGEDVIIVDIVEYEGLTVGKEYSVEGILMDKSTGEALLVNGKEVVSTVKFTPATPNGTVKVEFTLNTTNLAEREIVVFETIYYEDFEIAVHADIEDEGQTVVVNKPTPPKTGDESKIVFWSMMCCLCLGASIVLVFKKRKMYKK
jgi:Predicted outer membrane protein